LDNGESLGQEGIVLSEKETKIEVLKRNLNEDIVEYIRFLNQHRRDQIAHQWIQLIGTLVVTVSLGINYNFSREVSIVAAAFVSMSKAIELMVNFNRKIRVLNKYCNDLSILKKELDYCIAENAQGNDEKILNKTDELHSKYISLSQQFANEWNTYGSKHEKSV
jgi:hypothetical protein